MSDNADIATGLSDDTKIIIILKLSLAQIIPVLCTASYHYSFKYS